MTDQINLAVWSTAYVNDLPDGAFLYIAPGGEIEDGKTKPRSLRFFPFKDEKGDVDLPHLRNAIGRIPQSTAPGLTKDKMRELQEKAREMLRKATEDLAETEEEREEREKAEAEAKAEAERVEAKKRSSGRGMGNPTSRRYYT